MAKFVVTLVALIVIVSTSGQGVKMEQNMPPFVKATGPRSLRDKIRIRPPPVPGFNLNAWVGPWSFQFIKAPCSWAIAEQFTDYTQVLTINGKLVMHHETMRNYKFCNTITSILSMKYPGQFISKDLSGDNWSGNYDVVATDYKGFAIVWGCTKWSTFDHMCEDPFVFIKTRRTKMPKVVLKRIEVALQNIFGVSTYELTRIPHGKPCKNSMKQG